MSETSKIKTAFVGAGGMTREHLKAFGDIADCEIVGITSRTRSKCEELAGEFKIPLIAESVSELYEKTQADLVVIAVSETSVKAVCEEAFQFPWKFLIEKPVGLDLEEARGLAAMAREKGLQAWVALNRRQLSVLKTVQAELDKQDGPRFIHLMDQEDQIGARRHGHPEELVQNWMYANSIHIIDYLSIFARGEVTGVEQVAKWDPANPGLVIAKVSYSSGDTGLYQCIWNAPGPWSAAVATPEAYFEFRPLETATVRTAAKRRGESFPVHDWDNDFKPGFRAQAEETFKAVRGQSHNLADLDEAMKTMELIGRIYF